MANNGDVYDVSALINAVNNTDASTHPRQNGHIATNGEVEAERRNRDGLEIEAQNLFQQPENADVEGYAQPNADGAEIPPPPPPPIRAPGESSNLPHEPSLCSQLISEYHKIESERYAILSQLSLLGVSNPTFIWQYDSWNQQYGRLSPQNYVTGYINPENTQDFSPSNVAAPESRDNMVENVVGIAKDAFERAITSFRLNATNVSNDSEAERKSRNDHQQEEIRESHGLEKDVQDIYNAWYLAGVLTAKYLAEQDNGNN